jgi:hypothetical protein
VPPRGSRRRTRGADLGLEPAKPALEIVSLADEQLELRAQSIVLGAQSAHLAGAHRLDLLGGGFHG